MVKVNFQDKKKKKKMERLTLKRKLITAAPLENSFLFFI